ncbi:MAG: hypothetical protein P4L51_21685 [Puia sp.]|nr:hypothetical protein [Puia sp.]
MKPFRTRKIAGIVLLVITGIFLFGNITTLLWNALMPVIFHLPIINFWQALGLLLLTKILFGGFRGGPRLHAKRDHLRQAWMNMNPEQREKFKQEWGQRPHRPCRGEAPFEQRDRFNEAKREHKPGTDGAYSEPEKSDL